ncbi:unnamed protein product [Nezara viridula]|uniref:Uncharacterized protein n=1 Tax=Nezara viridula TaxID=85310 RepID=A0A9P0HBM3_NEZVI|nr:unnamed protein product [Nezara viridula]
MYSLNPAYGYVKPKVDSGRFRHKGAQFSLGKGQQPPLYGTWPRFPEPCNTRQRRHYAVKQKAKPIDTEPWRPPKIHLEHLKKRKEFPKLRNSSQLANMY